MLQLAGPGSTRSGAANDYEIVSLALLKTLLVLPASDSSQDTMQQAFLDAAHQALFQETGRIFKQHATYNVVVNGSGTTSLYLRMFPISAVSAVEYGYLALGGWQVSQALTASDYVIDSAPGRLVALGTTWYRGLLNMRVALTAGYASGQVPLDLQRGIADHVGLMMRRAEKKQWDVQSESVGGPGSQTSRSLRLEELPKTTQTIFRRYALPEVMVGG